MVVASGRKERTPPQSSPFEGLYVVAKFYMSRAPDGSFGFISRTLGKLSVLDESVEHQVRNKEFWVSKIVREAWPGLNRGAFVLRPVKRVEPVPEALHKLIPGFYTEEAIGKAVVLHPKDDPAKYWIVSHTTRSIFSKRYHAIIVPVAFQEVVQTLSSPEIHA
jgi:hypothetical protein